MSTRIMYRTYAAASLAMLALAVSGQAATLNVPSAMYPSLPIAINAAVSGDEIVLAAGIYIAVPGFVISNKQLTLRGATGDPDDVVLDGFGIATNIVLSISGAASDGTRLESLTITGGVSSSVAGADGAGLVLSSADTTLVNCVIRDNRLVAPDGDGAGIFSQNSNLMLIDCLLMDNTSASSGSDGVALYFGAGLLDIVNSTFEGNGTDASLALSNAGGGGAIRADGATVSIVRSEFMENRCGLGGAIFMGGSSNISMNACRLVSNQANNGGGFLKGNQTGNTTARLRNCLFEGNHVFINDAAIFTDKPTEITNCTIVKNTADGSYEIGGTPGSGNVSISNSIIWGNTAATHIFPPTMNAIARNNTFQLAYAGGSGSIANNTLDPQFMDFAMGDYRLAPDSPAIDAGNSDLYVGPFVDLDGNTRGVDDPATADSGSAIDGPVIDKGCYEFQIDAPVPTCPGDLTGDNFVDVEDLNQVLSNWASGCN